jgi:hypothetical protein
MQTVLAYHFPYASPPLTTCYINSTAFKSSHAADTNIAAGERKSKSPTK